MQCISLRCNILTDRQRSLTIAAHNIFRFHIYVHACISLSADMLSYSIFGREANPAYHRITCSYTWVKNAKWLPLTHSWGLYMMVYDIDNWANACTDMPMNVMMTSSNGNIFRVTDPLCGEFTGHRWIPRTKASDAELWCFLWSASWINGWVNNHEAGDLRRRRARYDVIVMSGDKSLIPNIS